MFPFDVNTQLKLVKSSNVSYSEVIEYYVIMHAPCLVVVVIPLFFFFFFLRANCVLRQIFDSALSRFLLLWFLGCVFISLMLFLSRLPLRKEQNGEADRSHEHSLPDPKERFFVAQFAIICLILFSVRLMSSESFLQAFVKSRTGYHLYTDCSVPIVMQSRV